MLYDDSEIKRDGIEVDELSDDEVIENALSENEINGLEDEEEQPQGSQPEKNEEEETEEESEETSEEKEDEGNQPAPENKEKVEDKDNLPFHKHPRWKKVMGELQELREFKESSLKTPREEETKIPEMPKWFTDIYGENQEGWEAYVAQRQAEREEDRKAILSDIEKQKQEAESKVAEMDNWVDEQVLTLKEDPEIGEFDRNKLLKVMLDYKPTDDDGNLDFYKGYELYEKLESKQPSGVNPDKTKTKIKKSIASQTVKKSNSSDNSGVISSQDVRFKSFSQLAEE